MRPHHIRWKDSIGAKLLPKSHFDGLAAVCALCAKAPVQHLPRLVRMRATPLQFTRPFHHIHPPLPRRFDMLRSIQGRKVATRGDRLCVRYAYSGCTCAILNRTMPDVLAPFHSYIPIHAPVQPSRASTGPFAPLKMHPIAYVAARDKDRRISGFAPGHLFLWFVAQL